MSTQTTHATLESSIDQDAGFQPPASALALVGLALLLGSALLWAEANQLSPIGGMGVGPSVALHLIAGLLLMLSLAHFIGAWRSRSIKTASIDGIQADKKALAWAIGGMVMLIMLIAVNSGFILSSTVLFATTARAFGKPIGIRSLGIGLVIAVIASLFFTLVLTLSLPYGLVESILYPRA